MSTSYYAEYWTDTGVLQREGPEPLVADEGRTVVTFSPAPDRTATAWDVVTRTFVAPDAPAQPVVRPIVSKLEFLRDRLGMSALVQSLAREASDPQIAAFRMLLDNTDSVHLDDPVTAAGLGHLRTLGILTDADVARILSVG